MAAERRQEIIENRPEAWKGLAAWDHLVKGQTAVPPPPPEVPAGGVPGAEGMIYFMKLSNQVSFRRCHEIVFVPKRRERCLGGAGGRGTFRA